jgi:hypothetical protein
LTITGAELVWPYWGRGEGRRESSRLKDTKQGASATAAGREFQAGMVLGKKLNL